jgi:hypothetical protein
MIVYHTIPSTVLKTDLIRSASSTWSTTMPLSSATENELFHHGLVRKQFYSYHRFQSL